MTGNISPLPEPSPQHRSLLVAKLNPPSRLANQVPRVGLCRQVDATRNARLVLVRAPAGFGKTTALLQFRARLTDAGVPTAWLTLDSADNDASRLLYVLNAAFSRIDNDNDSAAARKLISGSQALGEVALGLIDRIRRHTRPFALFLDDLETVQSPMVMDLIQSVLNNLPMHGQMFIGTRVAPGFSLGRLRAKGELLEIGQPELRFSVEETEAFLRHREGPVLRHDDIVKLHRGTEGWVTALWLASMAMERHDQPASSILNFTGSNAALAEYLAEDVLARQPEAVRQFLLRSSILDQLSPAICNVVCGIEDSADMLADLNRRNLFVSPLSGQHDCYRYHSLFAGFLRGQLARTLPDELPRLHRAAAAWYERQGRPVPAIEHALSCGDPAYGLSLLDAHADDLLARGRVRLLARWLDGVPEASLRDFPRLLAVHAWALAFTGGARDAMARLESIEASHPRDEEIAAHALAMRPMLLVMMDRWEEAVDTGRASLERLPSGRSFADRILINTMANLFACHGQYQQARNLLDMARQSQGDRFSEFIQTFSESVEGCIDLLQGRLRQAAARFRVAARSTEMSAYQHTNGNAMSGILLAEVLYEANDCDQAERLLNVYVPLVKTTGLTDTLIIGHVTLIRIAICRGDKDRAYQLLNELETIGHQRQLPRVVACARLERFRILLRQGDLDGAREELERAGDEALWRRIRPLKLLANDIENLDLARLRWEVAAGSARNTVPMLKQEIARADEQGMRRRALKLRILLASAFYRMAKITSALRVLATAFEFASGEGFVRIFLEESDDISRLVHEFVKKRQSGEERGGERIDEAWLSALARACGPCIDAPAPETPAPLPHGEALTAKEIRVLQMLAEGYSNGAMAEKLFLSESTVRTHLRKINAKLNTSSRTQAVTIARRMEIIN